MSNGTIPENDKSILKEIFALLLVLVGVCGFFLGVGMVWGWGGIFIVTGAGLAFIGVRLGLSQTGKE